MDEDIINNEHSEVERLPLWRNVLQELIHTANHGDTWPVEKFEEWLKCQKNTVEFGIAISMIRKGLEHYGMHISQKQSMLTVLMPEDNARVMELFQIRALRNLKRSVILGSSTPLDSLTDSQKREHEKQLSKSAFRLALMRKQTHEISDTPPKIGE